MAAIIHYLKKNLDELAIMGCLTKIAFDAEPSFNETDFAIMDAMRRLKNELSVASPEELGRWLAGMGEEGVPKAINAVKGIYHEMEFVRLENDDGDSVYASLYGSTNHQGTDVLFNDIESQETWSTQLKATDSSSYVQDWVDTHPDGEILITEELAEKMGLPSSGLSNEQITADTENVVDKLVDASEQDELWDFFPVLSVASVSLLVWELWQRYQQGEISLQRFKWMAATLTGVKVGKLVAIFSLLAIPGINVVTGAALAANLIYSAKKGAAHVSRHGAKASINKVLP